MYRHVYDLFREGGTLGIFPEGGSHDRTEMLPLKAGVCIMALSTMTQYPELNVKIGMRIFLVEAAKWLRIW